MARGLCRKERIIKGTNWLSAQGYFGNSDCITADKCFVGIDGTCSHKVSLMEESITNDFLSVVRPSPPQLIHISEFEYKRLQFIENKAEKLVRQIRGLHDSYVPDGIKATLVDLELALRHES